MKHNAKFSAPILTAIQSIVNEELHARTDDVWLLDPFGGVGGIFDITHPAITRVHMVELQEGWARDAVIKGYNTLGQDASWFVSCGDFFEWCQEHKRWGQYNIVCTSPTYGNRMADKHNAREDSKRNTYAHTLRTQGEELHELNSGGMQWGDEYRAFHTLAWRLVYKLLEPGGIFILNIKDHIRKGELQHVPQWHHDTAIRVGFTHDRTVRVPVRGNRQGENHNVRVDYEEVQVHRKPYLTAKPRGKAGGVVRQYTQPVLK